MSKTNSKPEFYLAFHIGITPADLIARGFNKHSVYNYHRRYQKRVKPAFDELLRNGNTISKMDKARIA